MITFTIPTEHEEQAKLMRWAALAESTRPELKLLAAIPNGGHRNKVTAARLKAEGVKAGFPDIILPVPRRGWPGLFIEMKRLKGGRLSPEQKEWKDKLQRQGYRVEVCCGFEAAKETIEDYLR